MKRFGICAAALLLAAYAGAQDKEYTALNALGETPVIDGDLGDWVKVEAGEFDGFTPHNGGIHDGDDDASGTFKLVWTEEGLYLAVDVTDDSHLNNGSGNSIYNGDSVQVAIDPTAERAGGGNFYEFNFGLGAPNSETPHFVREKRHAEGPAQADIGAFEYVFMRDEAQKRTVYEAFFPLAQIAPSVLEAGSTIGFAIIVNDGDDGAGQDGQKGWLGWGELTIVHGKDSAAMNLVLFSEDTLQVDPAGKLAAKWANLKKGW